MKLKSLKINSAAVEAGAWVEKIPGAGKLKLKVRGVGNRSYRTLMDRLIAEIPRDQRLRGISTEDQERIQAECYAETIIVDWDNLFEDDDETVKVPFSPELALKLFSDPDYVRFYDFVQWAAGFVATASEADLKAAEGN